MSEMFLGKIIKNSRVTIPKEIMDVMGLREGDYLRIIIEKKEIAQHERA